MRRMYRAAGERMAAVTGGTLDHYVAYGENLKLLARLPDASVDAIVTDPPYGIGFMGREWDSFKPETVRKLAARKARKTTQTPPGHGHAHSNGYVEYDNSLSGNQRFQVWCETWGRECLRVLKPGGHLLAFGGCRTYHRLASGLEDAGFEIRDKLDWVFASGFPKSLNLDGVWDGWGSALKPSHEPIALARKPLAETSIARNMLAHGTGAINIDGCRLHTPGSEARDYTVTRLKPGATLDRTGGNWRPEEGGEEYHGRTQDGRWPPNLLLSHSPDCNGHCAPDCPVAEIDRQSGASKPGGNVTGAERSQPFSTTYENGMSSRRTFDGYGDQGGASRFFPVLDYDDEDWAIFRYVAKARRTEREEGLEALPTRTFNRVNPGGLEHDPRWAPTIVRNHHPTVKPVALMRWLCRLVTRLGGVVLDLFCGSGTTGRAARMEGFRFIGMEREPAYVAIARARVGSACPSRERPPSRARPSRRPAAPMAETPVIQPSFDILTR